MPFGALLLAVLALNASVWAATPVDIYQDMESGNSGDVLTSTLMNASSHGGSSTWTTSNTMWVSTSFHRNLPGPVTVGGVTYNGTGGTRTWMFNDNMQLHYERGTITGSYSRMTVACYYTPGYTGKWGQYDSINMLQTTTGTWAVLQVASETKPAPIGTGPYFRCHSQDTNGTTYNPDSELVLYTPGKTYWVNLKFDGVAGMVLGAIFDPDNGFAQIGSTMHCPSKPNSQVLDGCRFGQTSAHGNATDLTSHGYFGQILYDYTNAAFPLIPTGTDTTPPSAPPAVRDGTGADISTTTSTTQLSANWDASTDAQSGISGYQYAIGTSAGGTQTVNWTSLGNVLTVTKTGLSLTVGQTYYFSVRAVNGAGLTGSATNSNGQTVTSSSTTYFQDNFESWSVHGGAWSSVNGESSSHTLNTSTDRARSGTKSLKLTDTDSVGTTGASLTKNFSPVISGNIYVRFYVFYPTGYWAGNVGDARRVLRIYCGGNRGQMSFKNSAPVMEEIGAWGSTTGATITENAWHCIEMHIAAPSASTLLEFWVDGVRNSASLTANFSSSSTFDHIDLGDVVIGNGQGDGTFYIDEAVVSNAYIGTLP